MLMITIPITSNTNRSSYYYQVLVTILIGSVTIINMTINVVVIRACSCDSSVKRPFSCNSSLQRIVCIPRTTATAVSPLRQSMGAMSVRKDLALFKLQLVPDVRRQLGTRS